MSLSNISDSPNLTVLVKSVKANVIRSSELDTVDINAGNVNVATGISVAGDT